MAHKVRAGHSKVGLMLSDSHKISRGELLKSPCCSLLVSLLRVCATDDCFMQGKSMYLLLFLTFPSTPELSTANIFQMVLWMTPLTKTQWRQLKMVTRSLRSYIISGPVISTDPKITGSPLLTVHAKYSSARRLNDFFDTGQLVRGRIWCRIHVMNMNMPRSVLLSLHNTGPIIMNTFSFPIYCFLSCTRLHEVIFWVLPFIAKNKTKQEVQFPMGLNFSMYDSKTVKYNVCMVTTVNNQWHYKAL